MPRRATTRGEERTPLQGERADVVICGASFAGLSVARALAGRGHDVLVLDRYEIGERQTSACAVPTPWLDAMGVHRARRQELPAMTFTTPHGGARYELPWSWTAFDYRTLCHELWEQCGAARFACAKVEERTAAGVRTDRGEVRADLVVDALGWRRVLAPDGEGYQPPEQFLSRGLEVHPDAGASAGDALDVWVDRAVIGSGYAWSVPAGGEQRVGVGSYVGRDHVREPTREMADRLDVDAVRWQGNWFPHRLRRAATAETFFAGDSAGHCLPLSGEGIRTAMLFGTACGLELAAVLAGQRSADEARRRYAALSASRRHAFGLLLLGQRALPRVPPRLLGPLFRLLSHRVVVDRAFTRYLATAHPDAVGADELGAPRPAERAAAVAA